MWFDNWVSTTCLWLVMRTKFICKTSITRWQNQQAKTATAAARWQWTEKVVVSMCNSFFLFFASEMKIKLYKKKVNAGKVTIRLPAQSILLHSALCVLGNENHCIEIQSVHVSIGIYIVHVVHAYNRITWLVSCRTYFYFKEAFHVE